MNLLDPFKTVTESLSIFVTALKGKGGTCLNLGAIY